MTHKHLAKTSVSLNLPVALNVHRSMCSATLPVVRTPAAAENDGPVLLGSSYCNLNSISTLPIIAIILGQLPKNIFKQ